MSWPLVKLGDLFKVTSGGTPSRRKPEYYENGTIPWIKTGDLHNKYVTSATEYITQEGLDGSSTRMYPKGTVLVAMYGATIGACSILDIDACTNQACAAFTPSEKVDINFLYYLLKQSKSTFVKAGSGGAQPNISATFLKEFKIPLPPLAEQKRIAAILDKADAIRRKRQQAINLADDFLRSVFLDMFGDPVTNPKGWEVYRMGDVIDFKGGHQPPKDTFIYEPKEGYVRLIQIRDFKSDKYLTYIPEAKAKRHFEKDDVMIARYGPPVFQILRGLEGSYNVALMKAIPKGKILKSFIYYLLQVPAYHDVVVANSERTAGQTGVNLDLLNNFSLPLPPVSEQEKIIKTMTKMEIAMKRFNKHGVCADDLFNSLSQKAFAGEL